MEFLQDFILRAKQWLIKRYGWKGLLVGAVIVGAAAAWWNWDKIQTRPGVVSLLKWASRRPLPKADLKRFSVAVAQLENDKDGRYEQLIIEALQDLQDIEILRFDRKISLNDSRPQDAVRKGHEQARAYLKQSGADVLIWGDVLIADGKASIPKLYWTPAKELKVERQTGRYNLEEDLNLPALFWADLAEVLRLVVVTASTEFYASGGHFIADQLIPFTEKVRQLVNAASKQKAWSADTLAQVTTIFADSLSMLGLQGGKNEALEEAVAIYRKVLNERTSRRDYVMRALLQNNLGNALTRLGERQVGTLRLEEAVVAFHEALKELAREKASMTWAATQNNLGVALQDIGERQEGTKHLEEAVIVYREALKQRTRERAPLAWAMTQNNLGTALFSLGQRQEGTKRLEEAVLAYREALKERTRERVPLYWAATQDNLANVLAMLGQRESGTKRLQDALVAYHEALKERTRRRVPLDWATTQNNLGNTLQILAARERGTKRFLEAVAAYHEALKERTRERAPFGWAQTQNNLGTVLYRLAQRRSGINELEEAVSAYREALKELTRERVPTEWAATQKNLGDALLTLGERETDTMPVEQAAEAFREAQKEWNRERAPLAWARTQGRLADTLRLLGERNNAQSLLCDALREHLMVWNFLTSSKMSYASEAAKDVIVDMSKVKYGPNTQEAEQCFRANSILLARFEKRH